MNMATLERAQRENKRALRRLIRRKAEGKASTATLNAIDRRQAQDLELQRKLAALDSEGSE